MESLLTNDAVQLFILAVFPGLVSMHVYRLFMPARSIEWGTAILEGMFYSVLNFTLCLPIVIWITQAEIISQYPFWSTIGAVFVLLIGPVAWPILLAKAYRSASIMKGLQLPFPTAWDAFFDRRQECFMIIHLKSGKRIAGFYGASSYATSFPHEGDLYLRAVYELDEKGKFGNPMPHTRGLLIRKDEYSYIELFDVPQQKEKQK